MPALVCSAQNCVYNNAMYCSKGDIKVGGEAATVCQDTCCERRNKSLCQLVSFNFSKEFQYGHDCNSCDSCHKTIYKRTAEKYCETACCCS
ncbi:MAG: DUF1540 domain-containing protein [Firmicutes bacterium]|nr:DUF1540 domain-containing protein [Bacillota bacterium]